MNRMMGIYVVLRISYSCPMYMCKSMALGMTYGGEKTVFTSSAPTQPLSYVFWDEQALPMYSQARQGIGGEVDLA